jgi:hypothetical protein
VEAKSTWIAGDKAARRIAGHLNAIGGGRVLWIFGVAETGDVIGASAEEFSNWWPSVLGHFDGPAPSPTEVIVHHEAGSFLAVGFSGYQPPYVVRNPSYGAAGGGPVALEVPWREMTRVRSARHVDLIRILAPRARLPEIEVLKATLELKGTYEPTSDQFLPVESTGTGSWSFHATIYCVPADERPVVFPDHRTNVHLSQVSGLHVPLRVLSRSKNDSMILLSGIDRVANGPSRIELMASAEYDMRPIENEIISCTLCVQPTWVSEQLLIRFDFERIGSLQFTYHSASISWSDS